MDKERDTNRHIDKNQGYIDQDRSKNQSIPGTKTKFVSFEQELHYLFLLTYRNVTTRQIKIRRLDLSFITLPTRILLTAIQPTRIQPMVMTPPRIQRKRLPLKLLRNLR